MKTSSLVIVVLAIVSVVITISGIFNYAVASSHSNDVHKLCLALDNSSKFSDSQIQSLSEDAGFEAVPTLTEAFDEQQIADNTTDSKRLTLALEVCVSCALIGFTFLSILNNRKED